MGPSCRFRYYHNAGSPQQPCHRDLRGRCIVSRRNILQSTGSAFVHRFQRRVAYRLARREPTESANAALPPLARTGHCWRAASCLDRLGGLCRRQYPFDRVLLPAPVLRIAGLQFSYADCSQDDDARSIVKIARTSVICHRCLVLHQLDMPVFRAIQMIQDKARSAANGQAFSRAATQYWTIWIAPFGRAGKPSSGCCTSWQGLVIACKVCPAAKRFLTR